MKRGRLSLPPLGFILFIKVFKAMLCSFFSLCGSLICSFFKTPIVALIHALSETQHGLVLRLTLRIQKCNI